MSLETIVLNINEAKHYYGLAANMTETRFLFILVVTPMLTLLLLTSKRVLLWLDKYIIPDMITMLIGILLLNILIMKDDYILILIFAATGGCFYIIFTDKQYEKHKKLLKELIERIF